MAPGLTLISGFFDGDNGVQLIRPDGSVVNRWRMRFYDIFSDVSHIAVPGWVPQTNWNVELHGIIVLPDGSLIFNFETAGLVKMDRCGTVQWTLPRMTHHSVEQSEDGAFWVPAYRYVADKSPYPGLVAPYAEDTILKVSSDGRVLKEISSEEILFKNDMQGVLIDFYSSGVTRKDLLTGHELLHPNDVEELPTDRAHAFPQFAAGDLLVSLRYVNLIMVVDPDSLKVKSHQIGPWLLSMIPTSSPMDKSPSLILRRDNDKSDW
jgi:Arylsulfotransferase (ASST)